MIDRIIDFHTHTFPEKIVEKAIAKLSASSGIKPALNGTASDLSKSTIENNISLSIVMPVATSTKQVESINNSVIEINKHSNETHLLSFGAIHPDCENYKEILKNLAQSGIKGIKIHPVYQQVKINDIRFLRIIEEASSLGLIITTHAGEDISFPGEDFASPRQIKNVINLIHPKKFILAHMGGWNNWEDVLSYLTSEDVFFDTAFTCLEYDSLTKDQFISLIKNVGFNKVLFGTDSPWSSQKQSIDLIKSLGFNEKELNQIFYKNAEKLLEL